MKAAKWFSDMQDQYRDDPEYEAEGFRIEIYEAIIRRMEELNLSRADLAERLKCSKAYVTTLFRQTKNISLNKLVEIAMALDCKIEFQLKPECKSKVAIPENFDFSQLLDSSSYYEEDYALSRAA